MALPTLQDAKDFLRVVATDEDALVTAFLARAKAKIETLLGYPMTAAARTIVFYGREYSDDVIQLPGPFLATGPAPVFTDTGGVVVEATSYVLDVRAGKIRASFGGYFGPGPYTVVATIGLTAHPDYAGSLEAVASTAILDLVAHYYENRNPSLSSESGESHQPDAIPPRIVSDLMLLPGGMLVA